MFGFNLVPNEPVYSFVCVYLFRLTWEEESNVSTGDDNSPAGVWGRMLDLKSNITGSYTSIYKLYFTQSISEAQKKKRVSPVSKPPKNNLTTVCSTPTLYSASEISDVHLFGRIYYENTIMRQG